MKRILIVNDDGIESPGIKKLAEIAKEFGEVWVVAPESQRSAMSHRITYFDEIEVEKYEGFIDGVKAFACSGTPADCARVGIKIMGEKPDFVFSGINNGYNICWDIQYSATVGAALEAAFLGVPAIAVSQDWGETSELVDKYLPDLLREYMEKKLSNYQIWNINFPNCSQEECKGILKDVTVSKDDFYKDDYSVEVVDENRSRYKIVPNRNWQGTEATDLYAACNKYISVGIVNNLG